MTTQTTAAFRLDAALIRDILGQNVTRYDIRIVDECPSTNTVLLQQALEGKPAGSVLVALRQTAGRGRRGRVWHATPGASLTFSLLWRFPRSYPLHGLSLAVGVAIMHALESMGVEGLALKWPNDILLYGRKLGGVLVETTTTQGEICAVIGIGLNLAEDPARALSIGQPCAALTESGAGGSTEALLAALLRHLARTLDAFTAHGFAAVQADWLARNAFQGLPVRVLQEGREMRGVCCGVDEQGALLLDTEAGLHRVWGGEVSLRPVTTQD